MIQAHRAAAPLEVEGLAVAYGDTPVLWNVDLCARPGRRLALIGPNGAGKTTLLEAALGLVPRLAGEVRFFGSPLDAVRERVAYVPQREAVDWDFPVSVLDVVAMGLGPAARSGLLRRFRGWLGRTPPEVAERAHAALAEVGLAALAERPIGALSGGQQQRVFLARALARDPELFVLDEPFRGVDAETEALLLERFAALVARGRTVVAVHHDLDSVRAHFDDAVLVNRTVLAAGPVAEVLAPEVLARAYRGAAAGAAV